MRPRVMRTLMAGLLLSTVIGVIAVLPGSHGHGSRPVAAGGSSRLARDQSIQRAVATGGGAHAAPTSPAPPTSAPGTVVSGSATSGGVAAATQPSPAATAASPTTAARRAAAGTGSATGRLAVSVSAGRAGGPGIATMAADGSGRRLLVSGNYVDPQWTPDGRFVLFESSDSYAIWAVPAAGGPVTKLAAGGAGAAVAPDGTRLAYSLVAASNPPPLMVQPITETAAGLVATGGATGLGAAGLPRAWSPDGQHLLYAMQLGPRSDLGIVDAGGTGNRDLLVGASVQALGTDRPGFSADGSTVSFLATNSLVYFVGIDGRDLRIAFPQAVPGVLDFAAMNTAWSPDHQSLAVLLGPTVVVIDSSSRLLATVHLTVTALPGPGIAFDGSGRYTYYMGGPTTPAQVSSLCVVAIAGGASQPVGSPGPVVAVPDVWP